MIIILAFLVLNLCYSAKTSNDTLCRPFPILVPTRSAENTDSFIIVHQCRGREDSPVANSNVQCVNESANFVRNIRDDDWNWIPIYNHTTCAMACVCTHDSNNNANACTEKKISPGVCYPHQQWNAASCKCECKVIEPNIQSSGSVSIGVLMTLLVGVCVVAVSITYCIYRKRVTGGNSNLTTCERIREFFNNAYSRLTPGAGTGTGTCIGTGTGTGTGTDTRNGNGTGTE